MATSPTAAPKVPLFAAVLGPQFAELPPALSALHTGAPLHVWRGLCEVERGTSKLARLLAIATSLPPSGKRVPLTVTIKANPAEEIWARDFAGHRMRSRLRLATGGIDESLGLARFHFQLQASSAGIEWHLKRVSSLGVPLPLAWFRGVTAREFVWDGRYGFEVQASLPWVGFLVRYKGWLEPA